MPWKPSKVTQRQTTSSAGKFKDYLSSPEFLEVGTASDLLKRHVRLWQSRWNLTDSWMTDVGTTTLHFGEDLGGTTEYWPGHLILDPESLSASPYDGKESPANPSLASTHADSSGVFRWIPPHKLVDVPVYVDDLKHPPCEDGDGHIEEDEGWIGTYDPRMETVKVAEARLLELMRPRLRRALESIAAEDVQENGAIKPVAFRKVAPFEWLVRYQVLGERKSDIAAADGVDLSRVRKATKEIADLIGLTMRTERVGRPKGRRDSGNVYRNRTGTLNRDFESDRS